MYQGQGSAYRVGSVRRPPQQLGAILPTVMTLNSALSIFGLNSSDPVKDQQRVDRINFARAAALRGDTTRHTILGGRTGDEYLQIVGRDSTQAGSQVAFRYAQAALAEVAARRAAGQIGTGLIAVSDIPTRAGAVIMSNLPLIVGGIAVGYILLKRRGR